MDRRRFLQWSVLHLSAATLASAPFSACVDDGESPGGPVGPPPVDADAFDNAVRVAFDPDAVAVDDALFFLGVQSGGMTDARVVLWTRVRVVDGATPPTVTLRVWREPEDNDGILLVREAAVDVDVDAGGTVKVGVDTLAPSTWYRYAFFVDDGAGNLRRSAIGRVRTAWAPDWLFPITVAATTCTQDEHAPFVALQNMAAPVDGVDVDVFVHVGDVVYADGSVSRADYRGHWERALGDPGYRALLPRQGSYVAWDDHEFDNNFNPETMNAEQLANASAEFFASTPMEPNATGGLWQSFRWGLTAEFFVLDCRRERVPSTRTSDAPVYLGAEQMAWLKEALRTSPASFKVLLNSVPMTRMPQLFASQADRWQGYEAQRNELLDFLADNGVDDVWFLSGDFHLGFVGRVETNGPHRSTYEVAVGPGGNLGNPLGFLASQSEYREDVFPADQFFYGRGDLASTTLTFDPLRGEVRVRFVGVDGTVYFDEAITRRS